MEESGLYLAKKESDGVTSCFVATTTNMIPSYSLTHAKDRMESIGSESDSLQLHPITSYSIRNGEEGIQK